MISDVKPKHTQIPVRVHGIADGEYDYIFDVAPVDLNLPGQFSQPVRVEAMVEKTGDQAFIEVKVRAAAVFPCDRCLEDLTIPVRNMFTMLYVRSEEGAQVTPQDEEPREVDPSDPAIDLAPDVKDVLRVSIPMRKVCEEYNPGNEHCEEHVKGREDTEDNKGSDPRWDALKNLKLEE